MYKSFFLTGLILINSLNLFSQTDSVKILEINKYAYQLDTSKIIVDTFSFSFDSIKIDVKKSSRKIITINSFERSKSVLTINYYLKDGKPILVEVIEQSPKMAKMFNLSFFYLENNKIFFEKGKASWQSGLAMAHNKTAYEIFGYNENLNRSFLRTYIFKLLNKL